jgi:hypothetical protein
LSGVLLGARNFSDILESELAGLTTDTSHFSLLKTVACGSSGFSSADRLASFTQLLKVIIN